MTFTDIKTWMDANAQIAPWVVAGAILLAFIIARFLVARGLVYLTKRTRNQWDDIIVKNLRPNRLSWAAPLAVAYYFAFLWPQYTNNIQIVTLFLMLWLGIATINSLLNAINVIYESRTNYAGVAIQGYLDLTKLVFIGVGIILSISIVTGKSPLLLLGGLGALTAILLLIFQDTILDLVASVQIAANDLVKEGDWIEVPNFNADGDVVNMSLNSIKIQNFDKTFTVIPTHKLQEVSFKNWRGMSQSGGRRIKRSLFLDILSVHFCSPEELERLKSIPLLAAFVEQHGWEPKGSEPTGAVDVKPRLTNVGAFTAYLDAYLRQRPDLRKDMTILVRQLDSGPNGLPIEIYVFTNTTEWEPYEEIQASIFDHLFATLPEFGLKVLQHPSSH
jgi:miniconductance mechanosensitive channel